jgi:multidrug efflux pump
MNDIGSALNIFLGQPTVTHFEMQGRGYDVIPELYPEYMNDPQQLPDLNVRTTNGQLVPLANLVQITAGAAPQSLNHFQQIRAATITATLAPGYTLGQALDFLQATAEKNLPSNIAYDYSGQSRQFIEASGSMGLTFSFAIIFIFLILAAQFESFRDPLIVMISVPLSLTGALLTLHLVGATLNIYTQIGLITLIGLISKHGILMVEFANKLQEKGKTIHEAIIEAASMRLRPILMTTGAMLLGALPLVMASGAGAASRSQLGWTVFGGMAFGTLLTLFVVPTVYTFLATRKKLVAEQH